jgi:hypothetical protein
MEIEQMRLMIAFSFAATVLGALLMAGAPVLADGIKTVPVHFKKGTSEAALKGQIVGDATIDYTLGAKAGQQMSVTMQANNGAAYFNVLPPGSNDEAIFVGSTSGNEFSGELPEDGEYKVRVYLMRSAARRNEKADFTLDVSITGGAKAASATSGEDDSAARAGAGKFDATGPMPCAQAAGQPMGQCEFGVARAGGGSATVVVTKPDGAKRMLFFTKGEFTSADTSQADGNPEVSATREGDLTKVKVGTERYEIIDAVIFGG